MKAKSIFISAFSLVSVFAFSQKKAEPKKSEAAPSVTIVTLEMVKNQVAQLSDDEKQELLQFIAESLGYEMAIS